MIRAANSLAGLVIPPSYPRYLSPSPPPDDFLGGEDLSKLCRTTTFSQSRVLLCYAMFDLYIEPDYRRSPGIQKIKYDP